jgi:hypothetical protein
MTVNFTKLPELLRGPTPISEASYTALQRLPAARR